MDGPSENDARGESSPSGCQLLSHPGCSSALLSFLPFHGLTNQWLFSQREQKKKENKNKTVTFDPQMIESLKRSSQKWREVVV